jgi:uncharacterized repeat protein (TIGR01451 family)
MRVGGGVLKLLLAAGLGLLSGCFGGSQNPSYFPYLLPTGDIIRTHAKPPGSGYYANFDRHAVLLEVRPLEVTNPVRGQHVLIATVYDENGVPRRDRRIEWMIEGAGNIVEVDESGYLPGRGYKVDNHYAVSYTDYHEHRITRGNKDPNDDFVIRPGQSWCVITSAVEGDTHVTVYAPEIANWDAHKVFVTAHWVDADWAFPPPAINRAGSEHILTTRVFRHTDRQPLANYRVRYRILDGPPAVFLPSRTAEYVATSDLSGNANASMVQVSPQTGINRISIEVIRSPDPTSPSGAGIVIARGETTKEWRGSQLTFNMTGPPTAGINQDITYTITTANTGQVEAQAMTVRDPVPPGLQLVSSTPPATVEGNQLIWTLGVLPAGSTHTLQAVFKATQLGSVTNCASIVALEGFRDQKCVTTQVTGPQQPQLKIDVNDVPTATVNATFTYDITVSNPGSGPVTNLVLSAAFDNGLEEPKSRANPLEVRLGTIAPGENRMVPLTLIGRRAGRFNTRITATADGNLRADAQRTVTVASAQVTISKTGPRGRYVEQSVTWDITVRNAGEVPVSNVVVRDQLAPELSFLSATQLGQFINGQVVWNLGTLAAREQKVVQVTARCAQRTPELVNVAVLTADPNVQEQAEAKLAILGVPAISLDITKVGDPAVIGDKVTYKITVTNNGTLPTNQVNLTATVTADKLQISATNGPTMARIQGDKAVFPAVDGLQPRTSLTYTIEAKAIQAGDARLHVELSTSSLTTPLVKEESTNIYPPTNGTTPGPPRPKL